MQQIGPGYITSNELHAQQFTMHSRHIVFQAHLHNIHLYDYIRTKVRSKTVRKLQD